MCVYYFNDIFNLLENIIYLLEFLNTIFLLRILNFGLDRSNSNPLRENGRGENTKKIKYEKIYDELTLIH